jgi:hypothetical protein
MRSPSPSASVSPRPIDGKQVRFVSPTTGRMLRPSKRGLSYRDGQLPSKRGQPHLDELANAPLGPVHSSEASNAAGEGKGPQQGLNILQNASPGGLPLSSGVHAAEPQLSPPPDRETPRRSNRIQPPVSSIPKDPAKTASTGPPKRTPRSTPERKVAINPTTRSSRKPQGVTKRRPGKTAPGKARKK